MAQLIIGFEMQCCLVQLQPEFFSFPGFEQQTAADQKTSLVPSNSTFSPNSTLFPLSSIESFGSGSARSQVGWLPPFFPVHPAL